MIDFRSGVVSRFERLFHADRSRGHNSDNTVHTEPSESDSSGVMFLGAERMPPLSPDHCALVAESEDSSPSQRASWLRFDTISPQQGQGPAPLSTCETLSLFSPHLRTAAGCCVSACVGWLSYGAWFMLGSSACVLCFAFVRTHEGKNLCACPCVEWGMGKDESEAAQRPRAWSRVIFLGLRVESVGACACALCFWV